MFREENSSEYDSATLNLQEFVCSVCGEDHETENCAVVQSLKPAYDSKIVSRARQTLPKNLEVRALADGSTTVVTNVKIEEGTQFGPFQSPLSLDLPPTVFFPLKVFGKTLDECYYLDSTDEESCNWMCLVATATNTREQNLICYDVKQSIYFATTRDIQPGEELRLWYALYYGLKLQALPLPDDCTQEEDSHDLSDDLKGEKCKSTSDASMTFGEDLLQTLAQHLPAHALGASGERAVWICKLCGLQESNVASYARHLMTHYRQTPSDSQHQQCKFCPKRFFSKKMFDKHMAKIHSCEVEDSRTSSISISFKSIESTELQHSMPSDRKDRRIGEEKVDPLEQRMSTDSAIICEKVSKTLQDCSGPEIDEESSSSRPEECMDDRPQDMCEDQVHQVLQVPKTELGSENDLDEATVQPENEFREGFSPVADVENPLDEAKAVCVSEPTEKSPQISNCKQLEQSTVVTECQAINTNDQCYVNGTEQIIIHSDNGESFSTSFDFTGTEGIDVALENGEPITFIMVESADGNEISIPSANGNIILNTDLTLQCDVDNSSPVTQDETTSAAASSQNNNENSPDETRLFYNCDICQKSFRKCSYLYRHLRKHTGEFTCVTCLAVFARKENLKTHLCSQPKEWFPCPTCGKKFSAKKYLQRHLPIHTGEFTCPECKHYFVSRLSLKFHRCSSGKTTTENASVTCFMCERVFGSESKLKLHLKLHSDANREINTASSSKASSSKPTDLKGQGKTTNEIIAEAGASESAKVFICEVCGAIFKSSSSMKTHRFRHGERKFECEICKKRFHRKDVLQEHLQVHEEANFPCQMCGKKYKTKKSLRVHSLIHKGSKRFSCGVCGKQFFQKGNLVKHTQTHKAERTFMCHYCNKSFTSKEYFNIHKLTHTQGKIYHCDECRRSFVKKHLLDAHRQLFHSNRGFLCKFCNTVIRHRHSMRRHLEKNHIEHRQEWSLPGFIELLMAELPQDLLHPTGDVKLNPNQEQKRLQLLESVRSQHFQSNSPSNTVDMSSDFVFSPATSSGSQITHLTQGDPLVMLQQSHQLALIDNVLPDFDQAQSSGPCGQSILIPEDAQGSEGEILFTLVDQTIQNDSSMKNTTPVLTSAVLGNDMIGMDSGTTYMMEDGNGSSSVLLYVVETSNGEDGDSQDLVWCTDAISEQL